MKFDHFLAVLRNRVLPDPVFIPLTIKYLLENGPTGTGVLYDHYIDFLERNNIPIETGTTQNGAIVKTCPSQPDPHQMQEEMFDLELINESVIDELGALSLLLEDPDTSELFKDVEDFDGKGLLIVVCQEKIDTYIELARQKKTPEKLSKVYSDWLKNKPSLFGRGLKDIPLDDEYAKAKKSFSEFLGKQLENWYKVDAEIVAKNQQAARKKISAKYGSVIDPYGGIDSSQYSPGNKIFTMMELLIPELRKLVEDVLQGQKDQDGNPWHKSETYVPKHVIEQTNNYLKRSGKYTENLHADLFVEYMGEGGLLDVIKHNWKEFFKDVFDDNKDILNNIEEINRKRPKIFHFHKLTPEQQEMWVKKLEVYTAEILWYTRKYAGR